MTVNVSKPAINVREKLAELDKPTGIAGEAMLRAETPQEQFNLIGAGRRNLLINGDFQVWQRGTTFSSLTASDYTADRWISYASSTSNTTTTRQSFSAGQTDVEGNPKYFLRLDNTPDADTTWMELFQRVEDVTYFSAVYVTLSFWIKSNRNSVSDNNFFSFRQNFGSGGSSTVSTASSTFEISTGWEKKTLTVHLPSISGKTVGTGSYLEVHLAQSSSVTADTYYDIANVQLELGKVATPFEHRSYGEELALCQRYFQQIGSQSNAFPIAYGYLYNNGTKTAATISLATSMRATPSLEGASNSIYIVGNGLQATVSPSFFSTTNVPNLAMVSITSGDNTHTDLGNDNEIVMVLQSYLDEVLDLDAEL